MKSQEELDEMSMIELVEEFIATCDRVIERNNSGNAVQLYANGKCCPNVSNLGAKMTRKHTHNWQYVKGTPAFQCSKCYAIAARIKYGKKYKWAVL